MPRYLPQNDGSYEEIMKKSQKELNYTSSGLDLDFSITCFMRM